MLFVGAGVCALLAVLLYMWGFFQAIAQHNAGAWNDAAFILWIYAAGFVLVGIVFLVTRSDPPAGSVASQWLSVARYAAFACAMLFVVQLCRKHLGMIKDSAHWPDAPTFAALVAVVCAVASAFAPQR